uniref:50S ribosomal protein L35 n=1 Tax=Eucampia antarctica TaxID=49252 RepID=A0A7S2S6M9_9STRA|mmetsp:Transcript_3779/g.3553  ORF Transcript_3779/g.3553 Transcript_3779/m.3553 type:complete len:103 (+) Transcript_3779:139-447(+)
MSFFLTPMINNVSRLSTTMMMMRPWIFENHSLRSMGSKALIKTNKSAAKRFRVRSSGSIKRNKAGTQHNSGYKTRQRCNQLGQSTGVSEPAIEKRMRRLIGK